MSFTVHKVVTGPFQENCYLIWDTDTQACIYIDPGDDATILVREARDRSLTPVAIMNTHAHIDHIGAVQSLKDTFGIPFYLHRGERENLNAYPHQCQMFGLPPGPIPDVDVWIEEEGELTVDTLGIRVIETPGHTPGGICFLIQDHLFTGDTLFRQSVGRTDLPGGDWSTLESSLLHLLQDIPKQVRIHSGHGPDSTVEIEMAENPFLIPLKKQVNSRR